MLNKNIIRRHWQVPWTQFTGRIALNCKNFLEITFFWICNSTQSNTKNGSSRRRDSESTKLTLFDIVFADLLGDLPLHMQFF